MTPGREIERKFLVTPPARAVLQATWRAEQLTQWYLPWTDGEWRVRQAATGWWLTVKRGQGLVREETERPLAAPEAETLVALAVARVTKTRYHHPQAAWTLDDYGAATAPYWVAEIELATPTSPVPPWPEGVTPVREVTGDPRWSARHLATPCGGALASPDRAPSHVRGMLRA